MRLLPLLLVALVALAAVSAETEAVETQKFLFADSEYVTLFKKFVSSFNKAFSATKIPAIMKTFKENVDRITNMNKMKGSFKAAVNKFADISPAEFKQRYMGAIPKAYQKGSFIEASVEEEMTQDALDQTFAAGFDQKSTMLAPRFQDSCGSCWSFAAASTIEAAIAIGGGKKEYLSPQIAVDCAIGCLGCQGGFAKCAFDFARLTGYFADKDVPYKNRKESCESSKYTPRGKIQDVKYVSGSQTNFVSAVKTNPLWITLNADQLQFYQQGVFNYSCSTAINHAVVLTGYGTAENGGNYYIVRNSWGKSWGEDGYFRISSAGNMCGLHSWGGYYPLLKK